MQLFPATGSDHGEFTGPGACRVLHQNFYNYVVEQMGKRTSPTLAPESTRRFGFDRFEYGIVKRRIVEGETEGMTTGKSGTRWSSLIC